MATNKQRAKNIGGPLEYTVSDVLGLSVEELIDRGTRFTIINDVDAEEGLCYDGDRFADG